MKQRISSFFKFFVMLILSMTMTNTLLAQACNTISFNNNTPEDPALIPFSPTNIVMTQEFESGENMWTIEAAKNWSDGIYFYEMNTGHGVISGKILKQ